MKDNEEEKEEEEDGEDEVKEENGVRGMEEGRIRLAYVVLTVFGFLFFYKKILTFFVTIY